MGEAEMRIGLLLCDAVPAADLQIAGDYREMFSSLLDDENLVAFNAFQCDLPKSATSCGGYLISGSRSAVYEDEKWIRDLEAFIRLAAEASIPMFGVCFGLQVIATAFGGVVERSERGWGGGVHTMKVLERRSWIADSTEFVSLIMSHQDQVVRLPTGASVVGSSDHCPNFLVEFAPGVVGIQGHPEFEAPFGSAIYRNQREQYGTLVDEAIASLVQPTGSRAVSGWISAILG
jgi:GMP synthase (glutamine-hydrolysing)